MNDGRLTAGGGQDKSDLVLWWELPNWSLCLELDMGEKLLSRPLSASMHLKSERIGENRWKEMF